MSKASVLDPFRGRSKRRANEPREVDSYPRRDLGYRRARLSSVEGAGAEGAA